jgi:RecB family exonuclease
MTNQSPSKYSKEWFALHGAEHGHANPIKAANNEWPIRLSKSAFMTYLGCPRKYWWSNVAEIRSPQNHYMVHGTAVHRALENMYGRWTKDSDESLRALMDIDWENQSPHQPHLSWNKDQQETYLNSVEAMAQLEQIRLDKWTDEHFAPVEFEVKHTVKHPLHNFILVGMIDGVHRHPDGGLVITELKTGKATKSKLSKTRKELCYYKYMLELLGWEGAVYFYYLFPECTNTQLFHELDGKNGVEVWLGDLQGMAVLEKVASRSVNAMHKSLNSTCEGINDALWDMKWNDYFCTEWCEFNMSCESQMLGIDDDPTTLYTGEDKW